MNTRSSWYQRIDTNHNTPFAETQGRATQTFSISMYLAKKTQRDSYLLQR